MSMTEFREQDLTGARFERVSLRGATFTQVFFNDASLHAVDFTGARARGALFNGSRMRGVELVDVEISGELQNVVVNGVDIAPLVDAELNRRMPERARMRPDDTDGFRARSEEHTSELQSRRELVCRLLLEKKNNGTHQALVRVTDMICEAPTCLLCFE